MNETISQRLVGSVLVADDVDIMRVTCQRALEREGFEVLTVASGAEVLTALEQRKFDVAILDIRMPGISGMELLKMLRARDNPSEIIMITADADARVAEEAINFGASAILVKPFEDIRTLVEAVKDGMARVRLLNDVSGPLGEGMAHILLKTGFMDEDKAMKARERAAAEGISFRAAASALGLATEEEMNWTMANFLNISYVRLTEKMLDQELIKNFPPRFARAYQCLPLFRSGAELHLVTPNPFQPEARQAIGEALGITPVFALGEGKEIADLITRFYGPPRPLSFSQRIERLSDLPPGEFAAALTELLDAANFAEIIAVGLTPLDHDFYRLDLQATLRAKPGLGG